MEGMNGYGITYQEPAVRALVAFANLQGMEVTAFREGVAHVNKLHNQTVWVDQEMKRIREAAKAAIKNLRQQINDLNKQIESVEKRAEVSIQDARDEVTFLQTQVRQASNGLDVLGRALGKEIPNVVG